MESSVFPTFDPIMDWFGIWAGYTNYDDGGRGCAVVQDPPVGVRLAIQPAEKIGPVLSLGERPWETESVGVATILHEGGRFRMWYGANGHLCYAESADGMRWERPNLGLYEYEGSRDNNIIFRGDDFFPDSIICDPTASEQERYKAIDASAEVRVNGALISRAEARELKARRRRGEAVPETQATPIVIGAVSADGLRWQVLEKPLLKCSPGLDTQNILAYDEARGRYLAYLRGHLGRRRSVRLTTSPDFREGWDEPRFVLLIDPQDAAEDDIYAPAYCRYPNGRLHLMFPSFYHRIRDVVDIQLAVSRDGLNWARPERKPIVDAEAISSSGEHIRFGTLYGAPNLVPLGKDRWGLPLQAFRRNHNQFDWSQWRPLGPDGEFWWATWKPHRLVALEAAHEGRFALLERECSGQRLLVNYSTAAGGWLRFELTDVLPNRTETDVLPPIAGYSFADCLALRGDSLDAAVTWQDSSSLAPLKGRQVVVRVQMFRAKLFATAI